MIRALARLSVGRPVTVIMTFAALLLLGGIAWSEIPVEMMPGRFTLNRMWVWVPYKDSAPRETERQIVRPMEDQLATLTGLKEMDTRASSAVGIGRKLSARAQAWMLAPQRSLGGLSARIL